MGRLTDDDLRQFARDGYLVIPDVVPEALLAAADDEVDFLVDHVPPHEGDGGAGVNAWFMPRAWMPAGEAVLRESRALSIADELVAPLSLDFAFDHVQASTTTPPWAHTPGGPHIDGHAPGQVPPASFTMLVGVLLSDQTVPGSGNLWLWPGSHLAHEQLFRERGTAVLHATGGHSTMAALNPPLVLPPPVPVLGNRGDLVLAHFLLGHNKGGNTAAHQRRTLYYRLAATGHRDRWAETFLDAWTEYPRIQTRA